MKQKQEQKQEQKQVQTMTTELSYKVMQIGEAVLEIEQDYIDLFEDEELKEKIHNAAKLLKEISEQMVDIHAERMLNWQKYKRRMVQQGFLNVKRKK